jgi:hypothetical protein
MKCSHCGREIFPEEQSFAEANFGSCFDREDRPLTLDCLLSEHDLCDRRHASRRHLADLRCCGVGPSPISLGDLLVRIGP